MLSQHLIVTVNQKILCLLAKYSDKEFYEREIARLTGVSYGAANQAVNKLFSTGAITRRQKGRMYFYSINTYRPYIVEFKKLINLVLIEPLVEELKSLSNKIIMYGSCAQGTDNSQSDLDLFIVSYKKEQVAEKIAVFTFPRGFEVINIQALIKSPVEIMNTSETEQTFLNEVERGITLWEKAAVE